MEELVGSETEGGQHVRREAGKGAIDERRQRVVEGSPTAEDSEDQLVEERPLARGEGLHRGLGQPVGEGGAALDVHEDAEGQPPGGCGHGPPSRAPLSNRAPAA
jgi:hypothetical protein